MTKEVFSRVLDYKTGLTGASVLSALTIKYGAFQGFICQDYTVVQVITDAQGNDVTAQMGLRGVTLSPGIYISMASGDSIYSIILSSGSIILYDLGADMSSVPGVSDLITAFSTRATVDGAILESTSCIDGPLMPYFKKASFYLTPSAYKGGKLYAQKPITGNGDLTWTRGGDAFRTNSSGLVQRVPWNLAKYSEEFNNSAGWALFNGATVTANTTTSPDGNTTADTLNFASSSTSQVYGLSGASSSTYTFSIYAKSSTSKKFRFKISTPTGDVFSSDNTTTSVWQRFTFTLTNQINHMAICNESSGGSGVIDIWGAQFVEGTTAQTYLPTTDRLNFPRLSYMYGSCPSALLEPQRTNLILQSQDFDNASWGKTRSSVTANATTSPDGTSNADTFAGNGVSGNHYLNITSSFATTSGISYTISIFAKKNTNNFLQIDVSGAAFGSDSYGNFDLNSGIVGSIGSGVNATITNVGNGWYRCTITKSATSTSTAPLYLALITASNSPTFETNTLSTSVYLWGAQAEQGAYPTTYIPTTSATATRIADSFSRSNIYTNGLISASGGTWFVELRNNIAYVRDSSSDGLFVSTVAGGGGGTANTLGINVPSNVSQRGSIYKRVNNSYSTIYELTTTTTKIAIKWNGTSADVFVNGTKVVSASSFTATNMEFLACTPPPFPFFIQQMALFPAPLTDTECAAMTTI